tara:strand:- start:151 stop:471 length:321 start_codon:yes stop_codon:yes gene_type:complete
MINKSIIFENKKIANSKQQELFSLIFLFLKICFFLLGTISLLKIGYISQIRITRLREIEKSYKYEKEKYLQLTTRFDALFSLNGQQRFMKDQDQMITKDRMRVIWR